MHGVAGLADDRPVPHAARDDARSPRLQLDDPFPVRLVEDQLSGRQVRVDR